MKDEPVIDQQPGRPVRESPRPVAHGEERPRRLTPRVPAPFLAEILRLVETHRPETLAEAFQRLAPRPASQAGTDVLACRAVALLLGDLAEQGWSFRTARGCVWVTPAPSGPRPGEPLNAVKDRLRAPLLAARQAQLVNPAVRAFLRRMESRRLFDGRRVSILDLVDRGDDLAARLADIATMPDERRPQALAAVVRPVLQVAAASERCPLTGLVLMDVWRYFRHTWSLEYRPTPGRGLQLLVRNAARPNWPVIGIAALANAIPLLRARDLRIGWTAEGILPRLEADPGLWARLRPALLRTLAEARTIVRDDDVLTEAGPVAGPELERRLLSLGRTAARRRETELCERRARQEEGRPVTSLRRDPLTPDGAVDYHAVSARPLFVRKRAETLAGLLFARRVLEAAPTDGPALVARLREDGQLTRALGVALRECRKVGLASRLLDVNVCGAVPPYRELLGGKLTALALACGEVREAYRRRYADQPSDIASNMAGRPVVREAELCVLTTTSLYGVGHRPVLSID